MNTIETDNSPQARFVKNLLRKDHPELNDEQIELLWQRRLKNMQEAEGSVELF